MSAILGRLSDGRRIVMLVAMMALVHLMLLRFGNEDATPLRLLGSFLLTSTLVVVAQRLRRLVISNDATGAQKATPPASRNSQ
jgi:hypothetical protein